MKGQIVSWSSDDPEHPLTWIFVDQCGCASEDCLLVQACFEQARRSLGLELELSEHRENTVRARRTRKP